MNRENPTAEYFINKLDLKKHPEGGYYRENYRHSQKLVNTEKSERSIATSIYFLLQSNDISAFHQLKSDEIWYFHAGSPLAIYTIDAGKKLNETVLGLNIENYEHPQIVLQNGTIFGAKVKTPDSFTLLGCMVAPGFDFQDFKLYSRKELLELFPGYRNIIMELTHI